MINSESLNDLRQNRVPKVKVLAFYLPQFHTTKENDRWWGKGFTEWTNTKKAKPLFNGHYQPREPYDDNYYNLLNEEVRKYQAELAKEHNIYGFCYYHYWFKGKRLLEKPFNEVIRIGEPDLPFCLSWANEQWTRSWNGNKKEILMAQEYGDENDWQEHFDYLIKAFKDERYILVDNKPMFLIYRTENILNCDKMILFWDNMCKANGFDGIYIVETLNSFQKECKCELSQAAVEFEPMFTIKHKLPLQTNVFRYLKKKLTKYNIITALDILDYDFVWKQIIKRKNKSATKTVFKGAFVDWDNTARRGKNAFIINGATPEKFKRYFSKQVEESNNNGTEFIFINAWNEWAEGTYLEPDKKYGVKYLEAVKNVIDKYNI